MFVNELFVFASYLYINVDNMEKSNNKLFIEKAIKKHGFKYDYSLVNYVNSYSKIKITCKNHGVFEQTPNNHLSGKGCNQCGLTNKNNSQVLGDKLFIEKAIKKHGFKYDYSLVNYVNNKTKVEIICEEHGVFESKPNCHLTGGGCPRCVGRGKTTDDFIKESNIVHGLKYDYSKSIYIGTFEKIKIICKNHGEFVQTPNQHLNGGGCLICRDSMGEREIRNYLNENNLRYSPQKRFDDCRDKKPLPFDFYLPDLNICIEFQGEQHFKPINYFGGLEKFRLQQNRDKIKYNYCKTNKIKLVCIRYDEDVNNRLIKLHLNE